jgi:hypothetical protein
VLGRSRFASKAQAHDFGTQGSLALLALLILSLNSGQLGPELKMHRAAPHPAALGKVGLKEGFRTLRESD